MHPGENEVYPFAVNNNISGNISNVAVEYQMTINYFDVEVYTFPDLNGVPYTHLKSTLLGFNHHSRFEDVRAYIGVVQTGFIFRNDYIYPMAGSEIGFEYFINWNVPVILCEGIFDAIAIKRNAIPLLGKTIQKSLMKRIINSSVEKIYIALDKDAIKQALTFSLN